MAAILIPLVILLPWLGAIAVWAVKRPSLQHALAVGFSAVTGLASLLLLAYASAEPVIRIPLGEAFGELTFVPDGLAVSLAAIAAVIGSLAVIFSVDYMRGEPQLGRYYFLVLFFIGAMVGLVLSGNLLFMFFFWEITALCSYALISFYNDDPKAVAGGIKALIITQVGGVGLLAGALAAFVHTGSFQIARPSRQLAQTLPAGALAFIAFGFLVAAAAKSAQFPFQTWLPDAMEAPTPISALIHAATMVNAGVYLLARFYPAFEDVPGWTTAVILVGLISALISAVAALTATDLKRVLAYSTVSQLGYMVYAIGAGGVLGQPVPPAQPCGLQGAALPGRRRGHPQRRHARYAQDGRAGQANAVRAQRLHHRRAGAGGHPDPQRLLEQGTGAGSRAGACSHVGYWLMLLGAGLTAFYTFRMVWLVFFGEPREALHAHPAGMAMKISLGVLALGSFVTWLFFEGFTKLFVSTLPFHGFEPEGLVEMMRTVALSPWTWLALAVIAAGAGLFWLMGRRDPFGARAARPGRGKLLRLRAAESLRGARRAGAGGTLQPDPDRRTELEYPRDPRRPALRADPAVVGCLNESIELCWSDRHPARGFSAGLSRRAGRHA